MEPTGVGILLNVNLVLLLAKLVNIVVDTALVVNKGLT